MTRTPAVILLSCLAQVVAKGEDFISSELGRLGSMIQSSSVSALKKTNMMLRRNIISTFLVPHSSSSGPSPESGARPRLS